MRLRKIIYNLPKVLGLSSSKYMLSQLYYAAEKEPGESRQSKEKCG